MRTLKMPTFPIKFSFPQDMTMNPNKSRCYPSFVPLIKVKLFSRKGWWVISFLQVLWCPHWSWKQHIEADRGSRRTIGTCLRQSGESAFQCSEVSYKYDKQDPFTQLLRADDRGMKISPLEEVEEKWCSLYLCSRLLGLIILTLCKCRAASEKFKFTPFPKYRVFSQKLPSFLTKR